MSGCAAFRHAWSYLNFIALSWLFALGAEGGQGMALVLSFRLTGSESLVNGSA